MKKIDGKLVAEHLQKELKEKVEALQKEGKNPTLAVILVGDDPASKVYVGGKDRVAKKLGMGSLRYELPTTATQEEVLDLVEKLNQDPEVHGILVQLPLPKGMNESEVLEAISKEKDVDCFHPYNLGKLFQGDETGFLPCTPNGVIKLLEYYDIDVQGKDVVIVGRSNIVGKPLFSLMLNRSATVSVVHSKTRDLAEKTRQADILCVAVGRAGFITKDMVKPGAVVVDVGINSIDGKLYGDVARDVEEIASYMTPVPGGVGPMTITMLMDNTIKACR
ncbi:MAG: bifunctional methylenetetrahydrofolate dehydrogenase/methenyltetrahydrofolate cyclohydrolase FolD [Tissierellia bacterium]|jgi:methylenetetrahydrofolate dehydrogenase (NADP+)/methenyltetrahydrofolate cyclohydrolase|nr:bifunctional methylenetetrahydrofolate dehydrogenase/methenyltetrahydrofolate cyclohydrolase FolD [Tissierellia bacterium]